MLDYCLFSDGPQDTVRPDADKNISNSLIHFNTYASNSMEIKLIKPFLKLPKDTNR